MPKRVQSVSFKNMTFKVVKNEETGLKEIWLIEMTKEDEIYTNFDEILEMFDGEEGLSMNIKLEKGIVYEYEIGKRIE
jgi:thiamine biosynthesis protein ThiC